MLSHCTFDFVTLAAASNSLVAFCFCNLIIAILLVAGSKPRSTDIDEENPPSPLPGTTRRKKCVRGDTTNSNWRNQYYNNVNESEAFREEPIVGPPSASYTVIIHCEDENPNEEDECQNEEDDELRRRVEEFIAKVNRGWKAENLRMYAS